MSDIPQYKKKDGVVIVEALKLGDGDNVDKIANWAQAQIVTERHAITGDPTEGLNVKTPEGKKRCSIGMYVIRVPTSGQFFVMGGARFEALYSRLP